MGALYLFYVAIHHFVKKRKGTDTMESDAAKGSGFWTTVLKVELADIAFAVDSMLAAVALAVTLQPTGWFEVGD